MRTSAEAVNAFRKHGISIAAWARSNGFKDRQVRDVLRGKAKGNFGASHKIAVALGMKESFSSSPMFDGGGARG